jgi:hypothetical protein
MFLCLMLIGGIVLAALQSSGAAGVLIGLAVFGAMMYISD